MARPTKYIPEFDVKVKKLALLGATDRQIADFFEIDEATLTRWKQKYIGFRTSLKKGKLLPDMKVAASLYRRAIGYKYNEVTFERIDTKLSLDAVDDAEVMKDLYKKKIVTKEVPPDVTAQIFWLKNRQKDAWRDKQDLGLDLEHLSDDDLDRIINKLKNQP